MYFRYRSLYIDNAADTSGHDCTVNNRFKCRHNCHHLRKIILFDLQAFVILSSKQVYYVNTNLH